MEFWSLDWCGSGEGQVGALVNAAMEIRFPLNVGKLSISYTSGSVSEI
jgi:hypothetical protein